MSARKRGSRDGWTRVRFGDVIENVNDQPKRSTLPLDTRYVAGEHVDENRLTIDRWGTLGDDLVPPTFKRRFQAGDVLFHSRNLKKIAVPDFAGITGEKLFVLRTTSPDLLQEFVPYVLLAPTFTAYAEASWSGSVNKFLNWTPLAKYEFELPPIEEQRSRWQLLRSLWEAADSYTNTVRAGAALRDSTIAHLYSYGTRNENRVSTPIGDLPASWDVARLDDRYEVHLGKMVSPKVAPDATPCLYLRNENVQWNRLDLSDVKEMGFTARERERFHLRYGDVLACEGRHVGKAAMWREEIPGVCYQKALHRLRAKSDAEVPEYILHCFRYYSLTKRFVVDTAETTIPHLALERLRPMLFPFPPTSEQEAIVARVSSLDDSLLGAERRLADVQRLMKTCSEGDT